MNEEKSIKILKILVGILFIICLTIVGYIFYDKKINTKTEKNKSEIKIEKTKTVTNNKNGVYIVDVSNVVDNAMPSIVAITSKTRVRSGSYGIYDQYTTGAGSGIIINKTNKELMILTNYHVVEDAATLNVKFINDKSVDARVKGKYESKDIAVITVNIDDLDEDTLNSIKIATLGDSKKLKVGQGIIAIGNALGYGQSVTTGVISALNREVNIEGTTNNMIQIDAAINGGNSGGALLNSNGEVIGINSAKYSSRLSNSSKSIEGMGFAIPISDVNLLIDKIVKGENVKENERGYLGISGYMITETYSEAYDIPVGFYVSIIVRNSGAEQELQKGDIITEIDGKKVTNFSSINQIFEDKKSGEKVTLKIKRNEGNEFKDKTVQVVLSSYKKLNS